jgi:hypothetical protein
LTENRIRLKISSFARSSAFHVAGPAFREEAIMGTRLDRNPVENVFHLRSVVDGPITHDAGSFAEKHYRIGELAERWGLGRETVRKLVKDEPGVIQIRQGRKKTHTTYTIPESVARRIHTRMSHLA